MTANLSVGKLDRKHVKRCRYCGGRIVWAQNTYGRPHPVDPEPVMGEAGIVSLTPTGWTMQPYRSYTQADGYPKPDGPLYRAHDCSRDNDDHERRGVSA